MPASGNCFCQRPVLLGHASASQDSCNPLRWTKVTGTPWRLSVLSFLVAEPGGLEGLNLKSFHALMAVLKLLAVKLPFGE